MSSTPACTNTSFFRQAMHNRWILHKYSFIISKSNCDHIFSTFKLFLTYRLNLPHKNSKRPTEQKQSMKSDIACRLIRHQINHMSRIRTDGNDWTILIIINIQMADEACYCRSYLSSPGPVRPGLSLLKLAKWWAVAPCFMNLIRMHYALGFESGLGHSAWNVQYIWQVSSPFLPLSCLLVFGDVCYWCW